MSTVRTCTRAGPHSFTRLRSARRNRHTAVTAKRGHSEVVRFCAESNRLNPSSALPSVLGGHSTRPSSVLVDLECAAVPAETRWSERAATVQRAPTTNVRGAPHNKALAGSRHRVSRQICPAVVMRIRSHVDRSARFVQVRTSAFAAVRSEWRPAARRGSKNSSASDSDDVPSS